MLGGGLCIVFYTKYNNTILQIQVEWSTVEDTEGGTSLFAHCTHCKHWPRSSPVNTRIFRTSLNGFRRYEWSLLLSHCFTPNLRVWSKTTAEVSYLVEKNNFEACSLCSVFSWVSCFQQRGAGSHQGTKQVQSPKKVKIEFKNWDLFKKTHCTYNAVVWFLQILKLVIDCLLV